MTEIRGIRLKAQIQSIVPVSRGGVYVHFIEIRPHVARSVGEPGILAFRRRPVVVPVDISVPRPPGFAVGERARIRFLIPIISWHHPHMCGIAKSRWSPDSFDGGILLIRKRSALDRDFFAVNSFHPGDQICHPVDGTVGEVQIIFAPGTAVPVGAQNQLGLPFTKRSDNIEPLGPFIFQIINTVSCKTYPTQYPT